MQGRCVCSSCLCISRVTSSFFFLFCFVLELEYDASSLGLGDAELSSDLADGLAGTAFCRRAEGRNPRKYCYFARISADTGVIVAEFISIGIHSPIIRRLSARQPEKTQKTKRFLLKSQRSRAPSANNYAKLYLLSIFVSNATA